MKKTAAVFAILLAVCLAMGACSKQGEVEKPAQKIPEPAAEQAADTAVSDTAMFPDSTSVDSVVSDTGSTTE